MADFLSRMAERAMGLQPVAMPLLRPIFATPRTSGTQVMEEMPMTPERPQPFALHDERQTPLKPSPTGEERRHNPAQAVRTQHTAPAEEFERRVSPLPPRSTEETRPRPTLTEVIQQVYSVPMANAAEHPSRVPHAPAELRKNREPQKSKESKGTPSGTIELRTERVLPHPPPIAATPMPEKTQAGKNKRATPVPSRVLEPIRARTEERPFSHDVHVSIGRVELKAATPPTPVMRPPAPQRNHLSLDDYLNRRRGARP